MTGWRESLVDRSIEVLEDKLCHAKFNFTSKEHFNHLDPDKTSAARHQSVVSSANLVAGSIVSHEMRSILSQTFNRFKVVPLNSGVLIRTTIFHKLTTFPLLSFDNFYHNPLDLSVCVPMAFAYLTFMERFYHFKDDDYRLIIRSSPKALSCMQYSLNPANGNQRDFYKLSLVSYSDISPEEILFRENYDPQVEPVRPSKRQRTLSFLEVVEHQKLPLNDLLEHLGTSDCVFGEKF